MLEHTNPRPLLVNGAPGFSTGDRIHTYLTMRATTALHPRGIVVSNGGAFYVFWDGAPERIALGLSFGEAGESLTALIVGLNGEFLR